MTERYTLKEGIIKVLEQASEPLSRGRVHNKLQELGSHNLTDCQKSKVWDKTGEILKSDTETFILYGVGVKKYWLKSRGEYQKAPDKDISNTATDGFHERALHPLLVKFINEDPYFKAYCKTIFHEESKNGKKGENQWLYPDVIAVQFAKDKYKNIDPDLMPFFDIPRCSIFSFEIKKELNTCNFTACLSQALNNSLWANEGYLVALKIEPELLEQIKTRRDIPIGIIELKASDISKSITHQYSQRRALDIRYIDTLFGQHDKFKKFFKDVQDTIKGGKVDPDDYDTVFKDGEVKKYIRNHKIG
ncbi:hypothetical protein BKH46_01795 [Helicobacter sp. 12S02634-8]|uniref:hypothetical protein n=1 Tax=Helicobacter sp. 12S02634-8 TaxID=1476199 RepID=UPI000BA5B8ED|nr:hypothetical protein [Helicobacter sp. 12S02634-8]PAF48068.1 hypothetical protein BKH46_01795 [Helicobacter sp. 12S02634-8]